jgi:hypothetical protein
LRWSGGPPETWAYRYYDAVPTGPGDRVEPVDVLAGAVLHRGLSRRDLAFFSEQPEVLTDWLSGLPSDVELADADDVSMNHLAILPDLRGAISLGLLSKVAHRKRPRLIPLFDHVIADWYRPVTGERGVSGWPDLVGALRADLAMPANRKALNELAGRIGSDLDGPPLSALRLLDIAVWMAGANR